VARRPTDIVHLKLRLPEHLRRRIEAAAVKGKTSMNSEIIERLEQTFQKEDSIARERRIAEEAASLAAKGVTGTVEQRLTEILDRRSGGTPPGPTGGYPFKWEGKNE